MQLTTTNKTMSSIEIAELTGKRHDNVMNDIKKMIESLDLDAPSFLGTQVYGNNNTREVFNLPKRESLILVSGYSIELRAKIIDRWEELENQQSKPMSPGEMIVAQAQLLLDIERKQAIQDKRIDQLESKIEAKFTNEFKMQLVTPTELGQMFTPKISAQAVNKLLMEMGFQYKVSKSWVSSLKGNEYSYNEPIQKEGVGMIYQLKWQRRIKELIS